MGSRRVFVSMLAGLVMACGGADDSSDEVSEAGLEPSLSLSRLSDGEREDFCAWVVALQGGDGAELTCNEVPYTVSFDACLDSDSARMAVTVEEAEACALAMADADSFCTVTDTEACAAVRDYLASLPPENGTCKGNGGSKGDKCDPPTWGGTNHSDTGED